MTPAPKSGGRLADLLPLPGGRLPILAEYPYYRAAPEAWADNLRGLRELGADVITAYVPWRLHELGPDPAGGLRYDFQGDTHPQRDLFGFLDRAAAAGLLVILKPGPYVHGEIRLGGLPDRVTAFPARRSLDGGTVTEERLPMPSAHAPAFARAAAEWLTAFRERVLERWAAPHGPVVALQVGNEGIFGEIHRPMDSEDFSEAALRGHADRTGEKPAVPADPDGRMRWAVQSGAAIREALAAYRDTLSGTLPLVLNLPLPGLPGPRREPEAWLVRAADALPEGVLAGNTSWSGNARTSDEALAALWLGMRLHRTDTLEDNWGFTWSDESYTDPATPLYNVMLGLAFGSSVVSVYTACTTYHWAPGIGPDEDGLRAEGRNPDHFAPPYCPGAPLDESGKLHPNASALRLLDVFSDWAGGFLRRTRPEPGAWLVADPVAVAESAWPTAAEEAGPTPVGVAVTAALRWMLNGGAEVDVLPQAPDADGGVLLVAGGGSMRRRTQQALAELVSAGQRCVVVGPVPERDEHGDVCDLLGQALRAAGDTGRHVPVAAADLDASVARVLEALGMSPDGAEAGGGAVLVLRRRADDAEVVWLFNRSDSPRTVADVLDGGVTVRLAPRGAAVLVADGRELRYFLVHTGTAESTEPASLNTGHGESELQFHDHTVGRRTATGWELHAAEDVTTGI